MLLSSILLLLTACDSAEKLVEKGLNEIADNNTYGEYEENALEYFSKAIKKDPAFTQAYFERGKLKLQHGWDVCKDDFYKCVEIDPAHIEVWKIIAEEEPYTEPEKKHLAAERALELDPNFLDAYIILGKIAMGEKNYENANKYLMTCLERKPDGQAVNITLGELRLQQKKYYESYEAFQKGFYPDDYKHKALHHIKKAAREGDFQAKEYLKNINETDLTYFDMAKLLFEEKEFDKAMHTFNVANNYTENNETQKAEIKAYMANIRYTLACEGKYDYENSSAIVNQGRKAAFEAAEFEIKSSLEIQKTAFAYKTLGDIKWKQGFFEEAVDAYSATINFEKNNANLYINRALLLRGLDRHSEAIDDINKAISLKGSSDYYVWFRADVYKSYGKLTKAREGFEAVLKSNPKYYNALRGLAELELDGNYYYAAYIYMQKIVKFHGKSQWITDAMNTIPENELTKEMRDFRSIL